MSCIDADEIEVFLVLAEELHFGRTADRLHLAQPRVSRLIASLERRTGGKLFERTSRRVRLTPLGKRLRERVGPAWAELEAAFGDARAAARVTHGTLRLGWPSTAGGPTLSLLVEAFRSSYPDCELAVHDVPVTDLYGPLRRGEIDVLAYWLARDEPDLTAGPVIELRDRVLLLSRGHRLAGRESVSVEDLADEEVHDNSGTFPAAVFDALVPPGTPSGRPIRRTYPWQNNEDIITQIASGLIVHPTVAGIAMFQRDDLVCVPIRDMPPLPLGLIWCTAHENARIRALAAVAGRTARHQTALAMT